MQHDFKHFLRHGGNGEYLLQKKYGRIFGRSLLLKSQFPGHEQLRQDFRRRLEAVSDDNARMILSALTLPDTPPLYSEADLLPAAEIIDQVLQHWDKRLEDIYVRYQNHPQRLRPLRRSMEDQTALSFAGLINQLRQEDLGIERYVWITQGDHKVRPEHAALHGEVFSWDHPSDEGHPGQAANCRCHAVPHPAGSSNILLADFTLSADGVGTLPEAALRRALQQLVAKTPAGAAVLAAMGTATGLRQLTQMMGDARLHRAAERLGLDVTSVEGLWAAYASARLLELAGVGLPGIPKTADAAQIAGQAAALYELMAPGTMLHGPRDAQADLLRFAADAWRAHEQGRLQLTPNGWAQGWVEVFPELTEDERRLAELPGFTGKQQEAFILADPVLNDGLPAHTGHAPETDPIGNVISTPAPGPERPNILEARPSQDFITPSGNVVRNHGPLSGKAYMLQKGHTPETVDEIFSSPLGSYPVKQGDNSTGGKQSATVLWGRSGDWLVINDVTRKIIQINDKNNPKQRMPDEKE